MSASSAASLAPLVIVLTIIVARAGEPEAQGLRPLGLQYDGLTLDDWRYRMKNIDPQGSISDATFEGLRGIILDRQAPWFTGRQRPLTLGRLGKPAAAIVPDLITILDEPYEHAETSGPLWALKALSFFGADARAATPRVAALFLDPQEPLIFRLTATETLGRIGGSHPEAIPALLRIAAETNGNVGDRDALELRVTSIEALELAASPGALPVLMSLTEDAAERVRRAAVTALGSLGLSGEPAIETIATLILFDESSYVREAAGRALPRIGPAAIPALVQLSENEQPEVRRMAVVGLGQLGTVARPAAESLKPLFHDENPAVAVAAVRAYWTITQDTSTVLPELLVFLSNDDRQIRKAASDVLLQIGPEVVAIKPQIERLRETGNTAEQAAARRILNGLNNL